MHCPAGNATDPIWRVLASSQGIPSWTPLKPQHSTPSPNSLANQLRCIEFLTPLTPFIIPHKLRAFLESLMALKNWCSIHERCSKNSLKHFFRFFGIFSKFKTEFFCISFFKSFLRPDCIFEIHQLGQSAFIRVYSNSYCSCWFEPESIKIGQSSHMMYSNNIANFQESTTTLNACTKKAGNLLKAPRIWGHIYSKLILFLFTFIAFIFQNCIMSDTVLTNKMKRYTVTLKLKADHLDFEIARFLRVARSIVHKIRKEVENKMDNVMSVSKRKKKHPTCFNSMRTPKFIHKV